MKQFTNILFLFISTIVSVFVIGLSVGSYSSTQNFVKNYTPFYVKASNTSRFPVEAGYIYLNTKKFVNPIYPDGFEQRESYFTPEKMYLYIDNKLIGSAKPYRLYEWDQEKFDEGYGMYGYNFVLKLDCNKLPKYDKFIDKDDKGKTYIQYGYKSKRVKYVAKFKDGEVVTITPNTPPIMPGAYRDIYFALTYKGSMGITEATIKKYCPKIGTYVSSKSTKSTKKSKPKPTKTPTPTPTIKLEQKNLKIQNLNTNNIKHVKNLILENQHGQIVFNAELDLSKDRDKLNKLDKYVIINKNSIEVKTDKIPSLKNKPATLIMTNLTFESTPTILVDGHADTDHIVSNVRYNPNTGVLIFDVKHFTKFEAVESNTTPTNSVTPTVTTKPLFDISNFINNIQMDSTYLWIITGVVALIIFFLLILIIKKRKAGL